MKIRSRINRIKNYKNVELIKEELYSVFSIILMDREYFKRNIEIKEFIQDYKTELNYHFEKEYLFASRPDIVAKVIQGIFKVTDNSSQSIVSKLIKFADKVDPENTRSDESIKPNKEIEEMLKRFGNRK